MITWMLRIESPPTAKKLSCTPTRRTRNTSLPRRRQRLLHGRPRRHTYSRHRRSVCPPSGAGSALRSTLPLGVRGSASRTTNADGTMYPGNVCASCSRSAAAVGALPAAATTYATSRLVPATSSRASTTASRTSDRARSCASISPSSMRKPRIFT